MIEMSMSTAFIGAIVERVTENLKDYFERQRKQAEGDPGGFLTIEDLANYTGFSVSWLYNNYKTLIPHFYKQGEDRKRGKPYFKRSEIDSWLESYRAGIDRKPLPTFRTRKK